MRRLKRPADERRTSLHLPRALIKAAMIRAAEDGVTFREVVRRALETYLAAQPDKEDDR
jgi:hypothetical protein